MPGVSNPSAIGCGVDRPGTQGHRDELVGWGVPHTRRADVRFGALEHVDASVIVPSVRPQAVIGRCTVDRVSRDPLPSQQVRCRAARGRCGSGRREREPRARRPAEPPPRGAAGTPAGPGRCARGTRPLVARTCSMISTARITRPSTPPPGSRSGAYSRRTSTPRAARRAPAGRTAAGRPSTTADVPHFWPTICAPIVMRSAWWRCSCGWGRRAGRGPVVGAG